MAPKEQQTMAQDPAKEIIEVLQEDVDEPIKSKQRQRQWYDADGRFGWFQVLAAGITFFMLPGITRSFSLLYEKLIDQFQRSDSVTAWVPSVQGTVKMCSSPIVGLLIQRFNERTVAFLGSVMASVALVLTAVSPNLECVFLFYGFFYGFGFNCCVISCQTNIAKYFEKKRGRALGLAAFCIPLGSLAWSPLIQFLFEEYDYRGAMLIIAAVISHITLSAVLMRPIPKDKLAARAKAPKKDDSKHTDLIPRTKTDKIYNINEDIAARRRQDTTNSDELTCMITKETDSKTKVGKENDDTEFFNETSKSTKKLNYSHDTDCKNQETDTEIDTSQTKTDTEQTKFDTEQTKFNTKQNKIDTVETKTNTEQPKFDTEEKKSDCTKLSKSLSKFGSDNSMDVYRSHISVIVCENDLLTDDFTDAESLVTINTNPKQSKKIIKEPLRSISSLQYYDDPKEKIGKCKKILNSIVRGLGLNLLRDSNFAMYCSFLTCFVMCVNVTSTFQTVLIREKGYSDVQAVTSLIVYNSVDLPSRLISGWIYDNKFLRNYKIWISIGIFMLVAVTQFLVLLALELNFIAGMVCLAISGFARATVATQNPNVTAMLVGSAKFPTAIGLSRFFQGVALLISTPLVGILKDVMGTYSVGYMAISALMLLPAISMLFIKLVKCFVK